MKILLSFGFLCVLAQGVPHNDSQLQQWNEYKAQHGKTYSNSEDSYRMRVFMSNLEKIASHNAKYEQNLVGYKMGVNQFADMLPHEIAAQVNGLKHSIDLPKNACQLPKGKVASKVDWRTIGAVSPVKNQGHCGSCWSFAATGALEGQIYLKTKKMISLSEQNLIDCSQKYGNNGCFGGLADQAFQYIKANGGIDTEQSYPYTAEEDPCKFSKYDIGASVKGYCDVNPLGDENALMQAVNYIGPIAVGIDASHNSFQLYAGGVYNEPDCSTTVLDHGVLVVGYGTENDQDYWLVKNSWGTEWGEKGYIKMTRNSQNQCGIATLASYPITNSFTRSQFQPTVAVYILSISLCISLISHNI